MNDIVKIERAEISGSEVNSVNARELHEYLESKQEFTSWIKARIEKFGFVENEDYISFDKNIKRENGATVRKEFIVTIDMGKELAMVENNAKGRQARKYFIEVEKKANKPLTFEELSKQTIMLADKRIKELEFKIQQDTPKVSYAEAVVGTINPISLREWISSLKSDEGLKVGEREVISFLEEKYLYRDKTENLRAYAPYAKYFTLIPITKATPKGNREYMQLKVTGLGQLEVGVKVLERFNTKQSA